MNLNDKIDGAPKTLSLEGRTVAPRPISRVTPANAQSLFPPVPEASRNKPFLTGTPKQLETRVTYTKQTIEVRSNRDKNTTLAEGV